MVHCKVITTCMDVNFFFLSENADESAGFQQKEKQKLWNIVFDVSQIYDDLNTNI